MVWLSPKKIESTYQFSRAKAYRLLKKYIESGGEYIRQGNQTRVPEEQFTKFLLEKK
jgi:ubiquitin